MNINHEGGVQAVGKITSGLYIVTCGDERTGTGFLGSWIQQVSFDPMVICIAVGPDRPARKIIDERGYFGVSILGNENKDLMKHFYKGFPSGISAFEGLAYVAGTSGVPLLTAAPAAIECKVKTFVQPGDHLIYFGEVISGFVRSTEKPMSHVRRSGKDY